MKKGTKVKNFCLPNQNNKQICLKDSKGKWTVLYFYPKDNTSGCTLEAVDFSKHAGDFEKANTNIIGISPDSCESHSKFSHKYNLAIDLLCDTEKEIIQNFGVWKKKQMYGKEYMGVERSTFILDPEGRITHVWNKVDPKGHVEEVLDTVKHLQAS